MDPAGLPSVSSTADRCAPTSTEAKACGLTATRGVASALATVAGALVAGVKGRGAGAAGVSPVRGRAAFNSPMCFVHLVDFLLDVSSISLKIVEHVLRNAAVLFTEGFALPANHSEIGAIKATMPLSGIAHPFKPLGRRVRGKNEQQGDAEWCVAAARHSRPLVVIGGLCDRL